MGGKPIGPQTLQLRDHGLRQKVLGGSWVVLSRVRSRVTILITSIRGRRTPLITAHEPPTSSRKLRENPMKLSVMAYMSRPGNGGMDPYSSPYIIPNHSPNNPFPHSLLSTRQ